MKNIINNLKKTAIIAIMALIAIFAFANSNSANACDLCEDDYDIGPAIWMDGNGITHTSDGLAWGPDGIVYFEGLDDEEPGEEPRDLGPAIYMDAYGVTHTSDGWAWGLDGVRYFEGINTGDSDVFCYDHQAVIGSALWVDEYGNIHDSDNTVYVGVTVDEYGMASSIGCMNMQFANPTCISVNYLYSTNQLLISIYDAYTFVEVLAIVVTLPC